MSSLLRICTMSKQCVCFIFGLLLLASVFDEASASSYKCYNCNSTVMPADCGDSFRLNPNNTDHVTDGCDSCFRYIHHMGNGKVYDRGCYKSRPNAVSFRIGCQSTTVQGHKVEECFCNRDFCNSATYAAICPVLILVAVGVKLFVPCS